MTRRSITGLTVLLLAVCGCGIIPPVDELLGVHREAPAVELPPPVSPALQEVHRELLGAANLRVAQVYAEGVEAQDRWLALVGRGLGVLLAEHGAPAHVPATVPEMEATVEEGEKRQADRNRERDKDAAGRRAAAGKSGKTGWSLTSGMLGTKLLLTGLGLSGVGIMGALAWVWKRGKALLATRTALGQVVGSVAAGLAVLTPEQEKAVKGEMSKVQDTATEKLVAEAKGGG